MNDKAIPATLNVQLKPFTVPNFVNRTDGEVTASGIPLSELNISSLDAMAKAWLDALYEKAGHASPWITQRVRG